MVQALVITGYGINCEKEMALAAKLAGATCDILHLNRWLAEPAILDHYQWLLFPGGFSYGDELGAAKALANKMLHAPDPDFGSIKARIEHFVASGRCVLGVCNGFQLLIKLGLLPGLSDVSLSLIANDDGRFINRWCHHRVPPSPCIFTRDLDRLYLPVRHGEGKLVFPTRTAHQLVSEAQLICLQYSDVHGRIALEYPQNPNGSLDAVAGLCDPTGRIMGMMPHPEAFVFPRQHPFWTQQQWKQPLSEWGEGFALFQNAVQYLSSSKPLTTQGAAS